MKTLATCSDVEFLRQTNKIRKYVEKWLKDTDILNIRARELPKPDDGLSEDEKREFYKNGAMARLNDMLDAALETHAEETAGLMRLVCFMEPDDKSLKMPRLLKTVSVMLDDQDVIDFFTSLVRSGLMST